MPVSGTSDTSAKKQQCPSQAHFATPVNIVVNNADVHVDANPSIQQLFARLSSDMHIMFISLTERMGKLETDLV